ncbi:MAG: exopolysaccharide biosynthesis protein [Proteobacteria bacterium]|nr:exopolysaccharide biosynthesis protein [Pseudomonadota bacterium]MBI3497978.1 exopolysaccharide biosynthesis protein [Pseudomonadota bacterium]
MSAGTASSARPGSGGAAEPASEILARVLAASDAPRVTLEEIVQGLGDRTYGFLIFIFAIPNGVPGPSLPGLSTLTGVPLIFVALQMALGYPRPWLPRWLGRRSLPRAGLLNLLARARPVLAWCERRIRPRLVGPATPVLDRLVGFYICLVGLVLALPIPFGNFPPAWALALMALGLIQRDGAAIAVAALFAIPAVLWNLALIYVGEEMIRAIAHWVG